MKKQSALYRRLIDKFSGTKVLVIGDLMVDRFVRGKVSRISPEAPVPVVQVREETDVPGGSGNVVANLASLGCSVSCCGVVGEDTAGESLLNYFHRLGVRTDGVIRDPSRATTLKTRVIAEHQQVVRFDREDQKSIPHSLQTLVEQELPARIADCQGVILSDYGKGMISKALLVRAIALAQKHKKPVCVDPKLEHFLSYRHVTCITPNLGEALGGMRRVKLEAEDGLNKLGRDILKTLRCESVLITQGEGGMTLFERTRVTHIPTKAREVYDVTGAGDTVISVLTLSLACGATLVQAAMLANLAAGNVVAKLGTATVRPAELQQSLDLL